MYSLNNFTFYVFVFVSIVERYDFQYLLRKLLKFIYDTCVKNKNKLIINVFFISRYSTINRYFYAIYNGFLFGVKMN